MNWRATWFLLAVAAGMFAFIVLVEQPLRKQRELQASRLIIPGLDPLQVTNVEIHPWNQPLIQITRQASSNAGWRIVRPIPYAARGDLMTALLESFAQLEWVDRISEKELVDHPNAQEEYGFSTPRDTVLLQGSGPDRRLEFGDFGAFNDRISMQVVGNTTIYQSSVDILGLMPSNNVAWRDPTLVSLTNLAFQTLQVRSAGKEFALERDSTNHLWFMRKPFFARADTTKINALLSQLQTVMVTAFVTDDAQTDLEHFGLQNSATTELALSFFDHTNMVAGLQVGGSPAKYPDYAFAQRSDPGNIVFVAREPFKVWESSYSNFLDQHFISVSPALIESVAVQGDDAFKVTKNTNGTWQVNAGASFRADPELIDFWLSNLTNMTTEIAKTVVTDFSDYGLNHPALQYTIHFGPGAGTQAEAHIDFGSNSSGLVFERRLGEDFVNSVDRGEFDRLPRASWQLRDRQIWNFASSNVLSVTVHQGGGTIKYLRDPDGNWTYAPGYNNQVPISSAGLEECVFRIGHLSAVYWDGLGEKQLERFGFDKARHELEFEVRGGVTNEIMRLQFGQRSPYFHPYASVQLDGQRHIFEFPADVFENLVAPNLTLYTAPNHPR